MHRAATCYCEQLASTVQVFVPCHLIYMDSWIGELPLICICQWRPHVTIWKMCQHYLLLQCCNAEALGQVSMLRLEAWSTVSAAAHRPHGVFDVLSISKIACCRVLYDGRYTVHIYDMTCCATICMTRSSWLVITHSTAFLWLLNLCWISAKKHELIFALIALRVQHVHSLTKVLWTVSNTTPLLACPRITPS